MAGTLSILNAVDSTMELVESTGEGLPAEQKPYGRLFSVIANDSWGKASIYDVEPEEEPEPHPPPEKARSMRKSIIQPKLSGTVQETPTGKEQEKKIYPRPASVHSDETDEDLIFWCLPFFQSSMVATILEDTITELRILDECNNSLKIMKTMADMPTLLRIKYDVKHKSITDELEGIDPHNLGCNEYKLNKLVADRETVTNMFINLYVELSKERSFITILNFVTADQERIMYAIRLAEEEARNRILRREMAKQLRQQRRHNKTLGYDAEQLIASLKSQVEDAGLLAETKGRYIDNWQAARAEQHKLAIFEEECNFTDSTEYYKRRSDHESRVHAEVESLTNIVINENLKSIEEWMEKYDVDTEKLDLKIQIQKSEYQNKYDKRVEMEALYNKRDKEMKEWIKFKEDREKEREYANRMNKSAITVQAWWRGLLVRKQLGPYRQKKQKK